MFIRVLKMINYSFVALRLLQNDVSYECTVGSCPVGMHSFIIEHELRKYHKKCNNSVSDHRQNLVWNVVNIQNLPVLRAVEQQHNVWRGTQCLQYSYKPLIPATVIE